MPDEVEPNFSALLKARAQRGAQYCQLAELRDKSYLHNRFCSEFSSRRTITILSEGKEPSAHGFGSTCNLAYSRLLMTLARILAFSYVLPAMPLTPCQESGVLLSHHESS